MAVRLARPEKRTLGFGFLENRNKLVEWQLLHHAVPFVIAVPSSQASARTLTTSVASAAFCIYKVRVRWIYFASCTSVEWSVTGAWSRRDPLDNLLKQISFKRKCQWMITKLVSFADLPSRPVAQSQTNRDDRSRLVMHLYGSSMLNT